MCYSTVRQLNTDGVFVPYQHITGINTVVLKLVNVKVFQSIQELKVREYNYAHCSYYQPAS